MKLKVAFCEFTNPSENGKKKPIIDTVVAWRILFIIILAFVRF